MCKPSALEVYGRLPKIGEQVSSYSASYPKALCRRIAAGALQAKKDTVPVVPLQVHIRSLRRIGRDIPGLASVARTPVAEPRPFHEDPEWVEELADSLQFKELLRYRLKRLGHINVLECRVHKTLMKHSLGYIIGGGLYPGGLRICSSKNRSDAPSLNRPVPLSRKNLVPHGCLSHCVSAMVVAYGVDLLRGLLATSSSTRSQLSRTLTLT